MSQPSGAPQDPTHPPSGPPAGGPPAGGPPPGGPAPEPPYGRAPQYGQQPGYAQQPPGSYATPSRAGGATAIGEMAPEQQRLWACLAHLSPILASFFSPVTGGAVYTGALGPLVIFLVLKDRGVFVRRQAAEALNFQILFTIIYVVGILLGVVTLGIGLFITIPILVVVGVVFLVFQVIAAVKANQGVDYRYPFNWRLVK